MRLSISQKLLVYFFFLSFTGVVILGVYSYFKAREALISRTFEQLVSVRLEKNNRLEEFFQSSIITLDNLAGFKETARIVENLNGRYCVSDTSQNTFINAYFHSSDIYESISFYSPRKSCLSYNVSGFLLEFDSLNRRENLHFSELLWHKLKGAEVAVIDNYQESALSPAKVLLAKKYRLDSNYVMLVLRIPIEAINHIMVDNNPNNGLGETGEAYLVGSDFLMRSSSRFQENSILVTEAKTVGVTKAFENMAGTEIIKDYRGVSVLSSFSKISLPYLNWVILAEIDMNEAMVSIKLVRNSIVYLTIIILLLTLGVVSLLSNAITQPIKLLKNKAEKVSKGNYGEPIKLRSSDEIGDLIIAFNEMTLKLDEQAKKIEEERKLKMTGMIDGQEMERQRLSRELHDSLGQQVLAIKMRMENAFHAEPKQSKKIINETIELFANTAKEIRSISNNLMPAVLGEFGLETALGNLVREMRNTLNIEVNLDADFSSEKLNLKQETYIFRICQEAFNNITKYAKAKNVSIRITIKDNMLHLEIKDDGNGFSMDHNHLSKGNGLSNMKERAQLLNGKFTVDSEVNNGTQISIRIPLEEK